MTEEQAKGKWCPFTRVAGLPGSAAEGNVYNRWPGEDILSSATCMGSACMAWRWDGADPADRSKFNGHCGLAGPVGQ